jgi:ribose 1,5-bisphosphokinase
MRPGRLIAVVGSSGVGKDTLINALCSREPDLVHARRTITRSLRGGPERFESIDPEAFAERARRGDFALTWEAHGFLYGIPDSIRDALAAGRDVMANLSRSALNDARSRFPDMLVLHLTARPETLAKRLASRGRETSGEITERLARAESVPVDGYDVVRIDNDGSLADAIDAASAAIHRGEVR